MLDGADDVLCRSNELSQAVIVTLLRADCCGHVPIMVPVTRGSTSREKMRAWQSRAGENSRRKVQNVVANSRAINGEPLKPEYIKSNAFVRSVKVLP